MAYQVIMGRALHRNTRARDARRSPRELQLLTLARELDTLAERFPRFAAGLNRLTYQVRFELRSQKDKQDLIVKALQRFERLALHELIEETRLDHSALADSLRPMIKRKRVVLCLRDGSPYAAPPGKPTDEFGRELDALNRLPAKRPIFFKLR